MTAAAIERFRDTAARVPAHASASTDLAHLDALSDDETEALALADPDNPRFRTPTPSDSRRLPRVTMIRRALGLTPVEFGVCVRTPPAVLEDWEHGRSAPDDVARAYLFVIAAYPAVVDRAMTKPPWIGCATEIRPPVGRRGKVLGVTRDGVRILVPNAPATRFTQREIGEAISIVRGGK